MPGHGVAVGVVWLIPVTAGVVTHTLSLGGAWTQTCTSTSILDKL